MILQKTCEVRLKEINTMTALPSIDPALAWDEQIDRAEPDLVRHLLKTFVQALMGAEAGDVVEVGAGRPPVTVVAVERP